MVNFLTGADRATRLPVNCAPAAPSGERPPRTSSRLERALRLHGFAITSEVRSPRSEKAFARVGREVRILSECADAINATSNHGGLASMPSSRTLALFGESGADGVLQVCGRDVDPASFLDQLVIAKEAGVRNVLCLTGDWKPDLRADLSRPEAAWRNYFRMDSSQMLAEARAVALGGRSLFSDLGGRPAPRPYRGAVINPSSTPRSAVVARLAQKAESGAEFIQTQIVLHAATFIEFMSMAGDVGLRERLFVLATIPVIGTPAGFHALQGLPGVSVPESFRRRIEAAGDLPLEGRKAAAELMAGIHHAGAADGFHLVNFGAAPETIAELALEFRAEHGLPRPEGAEARA
jgi:methylenetetrahydrofolate reductase (NADPH)